MYHFASSAVSTESKSYSDLLNFWRSRDDLEYKNNTKPPKVANTENSSKQATFEHTNEKDVSSDVECQTILASNEASRLTASSSRHLSTKISSLSSFRDSNKNIEFLTSNRNTVENICQEEIIRGHLSRSDNLAVDRLQFDSLSAVSDSVLTKVGAHHNKLLYTDKVCKKNQNIGKNGARKKYGRSSKQFKPKSESRYESQFKKKTKKKASNSKRYEDLPDHRRDRQLFKPSYSSLTDQDDEVLLPAAVLRERSLSFPQTGIWYRMSVL